MRHVLLRNSVKAQDPEMQLGGGVALYSLLCVYETCPRNYCDVNR